MPTRNINFLDRLQSMFNILAGVTETRMPPEEFSEESPWEKNREVLQRPALWRRSIKEI